jgi:uncharacterized protein YggU (UPF0235/DUF167 family)
VSRGFITSTKDGLLLNLRVSPGAKHTSIESAIRLRVAALPEDGKANAELRSPGQAETRKILLAQIR